MKSEITIYCDNEVEMREFAERVLSQPRVALQINPLVNLDRLKNASGAASREPTGVPAVQPTPEPQPVVKTRKARADAGKPRGPYKDTEGAAAGQQGSNPSPSTTPAAPAATDAQPQEGQRTEPSTSTAATTPAAPVQEPTSAAAGQSVPPAAPAAADPTLDDARAALGRINGTAGLGMEGCMTHLASFGINRISLLKKEDFARFIKEADEKIANLNAGKK